LGSRAGGGMPGPMLLRQPAAATRPAGARAMTSSATTDALRIRANLAVILNVQLPVAAARVDLEEVRPGAGPEARVGAADSGVRRDVHDHRAVGRVDEHLKERTGGRRVV